MPHENSTPIKPADLIEQLVYDSAALPEVLSSVADWRIRKILSLIHSDLKQDWRCTVLAEEYEISLRHFHRQFVTHAGISFPHYLNDLRVVSARLLLETTAWRLQKIAAELGFPNEKAFREAFKRKYGICPSEYRNGMSEKGA